MAGEVPVALDILMFRVMGVRFGIDTEQVAKITPWDRVEDPGGTAFHLCDKISFGKPASIHRSAVMLLPKSGVGKKAVIVDTLEKIHSLRIDAIRPFPKLMGKGKGARAYWGIALVDNAPVILIDFSKLAAM